MSLQGRERRFVLVCSKHLSRVTTFSICHAERRGTLLIVYHAPIAGVNVSVCFLAMCVLEVESKVRREKSEEPGCALLVQQKVLKWYAHQIFWAPCGPCVHHGGVHERDRPE